MYRRSTQRRAGERLARGGLLACCSAALAIAAHAVAGGGAPDTGLTTVLTVLVAGAGTVVADRRPGVLGLLGLLGTAQLAQHLLLSLAHQHAPATGGLTMTATHLCALVLTAALLAGAEDAVAAARAALGLFLPRVLLAGPPPPPAAVLPARFTPERGHTERAVLLIRMAGRRGPPAPH